MQFAPRSDCDTMHKRTIPVSSTGFSGSSRLIDVLEWLEEEEAGKEELDFDPEERRAGKRKQQEPDVEVASPDSGMELGPIRRGTTRFLVDNEGKSE